jgi:hypothetical protein
MEAKSPSESGCVRSTPVTLAPKAAGLDWIVSIVVDYAQKKVPAF